MLRKLGLFFLVLFGFALMGCQTSMLKQFGKLKPGMEKDDVLGIMGSPNSTTRSKGKDRWTYVIYDDRIRFEKEVQFFEGNAIYVGEVWEPAPEFTAIAMDAANDSKNQAIDAEIARDIEKHRKSYESYESEVRGNDKVRYMPVFEPVR